MVVLCEEFLCDCDIHQHATCSKNSLLFLNSSIFRKGLIPLRHIFAKLLEIYSKHHQQWTIY